MSPRASAALVFTASAAVLVVEITALRLLAPYLGLTLETSTMVIGVALTAIATGAWLGGRAADAVPPERILGPALVVSGITVAAMPFLVRGAGELEGTGLVVPVSLLTILVPGALLSTVTPVVTKLRLRTLDETGAVVGSLSGIGTAGAIFGTLLTGFVLVATVPVSAILVGLGVVLVVIGSLVDVRRRRRRTALTASGLLLVVGLAAVVAPGDCDVETTYHCAVVAADPERASGRVLVLDGIRHSYVDVDDPTHLEFTYIRAIAAATESQLAATTDPALRAYHLGGGAMTIPRWLDAVRPATRSLVSEIDPGVVDVDRDRLGLRTGDGIEVRIEDGRLGLRRLDDATQDLVVGDAFGGITVPWHLTTVEAVRDVRRVLAPEGVYVANLIDYGPLGFARAELATLRSVFGSVALAGTPATLARERGGNMVALASDAPLDLDAWQARLTERDTEWEVIAGDDLTAWIDGADVLTDDRAPVDQLLTPYPSPSG